MAPDRRVLVLYAVLLILLCFALLLQLLSVLIINYKIFIWIFLWYWLDLHVQESLVKTNTAEHPEDSVPSLLWVRIWPGTLHSFMWRNSECWSFYLGLCPCLKKCTKRCLRSSTETAGKLPIMIITVSVQLKTQENEMFTVKV